MNLDYGDMEESKNSFVDYDELDKEEIVDIEMQNQRRKKNMEKIKDRKKSNMIGLDFDNFNSVSSKSESFRQFCDCKPSILVVDDIYYNRKVIVEILKIF